MRFKLLYLLFTLILISGCVGSNSNQTNNSTNQKSFSIDGDDLAFYMDGNKVESINVASNSNVTIKFNVRTDNVYYAGLAVRGCGVETGDVNPGESKSVSFVATKSCIFTSYWPSTGYVKANLIVNIK